MHIPPYDNANRPLVDVDNPLVPLNYFNTLSARYRAVTAAQANAAAQKYIDPTKLAIVVVGDRKQIEAGLRAARLGPVVVVDENGKVKDPKVLRGIGGGCDEEALRVVKNMPAWEPGKQRGKPVRVQYNLPIRFTLR